MTRVLLSLALFGLPVAAVNGQSYHAGAYPRELDCPASWADPVCHWAEIAAWAPAPDCRLAGPCPSEGFPCERDRSAVPYHCPFETGGAADFAHPYAGGPFPPDLDVPPQPRPEVILPDALPGAGVPTPGRLPAPTPAIPGGDGVTEPPATEVPPNAPVGPSGGTGAGAPRRPASPPKA